MSMANEPVMVIQFLHSRDLIVIVQSGDCKEGTQMVRGRIEHIIRKCHSLSIALAFLHSRFFCLCIKRHSVCDPHLLPDLHLTLFSCNFQ